MFQIYFFLTLFFENLLQKEYHILVCLEYLEQNEYTILQRNLIDLNIKYYIFFKFFVKERKIF